MVSMSVKLGGCIPLTRMIYYATYERKSDLFRVSLLNNLQVFSGSEPENPWIKEERMSDSDIPEVTKTDQSPETLSQES